MEIREILLRIIKIGIVAVFLTPFILGPFGLNMSEYPKAVFFRSLVEIIFALYLFLILLNPNYIPRKSFLLFSVIIFDAIMILASLAGINFFRSFFGEMQRGEGIILHLHLLALFIMLLGIFQTNREWLKILKSVAIISGIESFAAVLQQLNIIRFYNVESVRLSGTFSNPDLFGSFVSLSVFLTIFIFLCEKNRNWKRFWAGTIILHVYVLFFSGTRASWLGFGIGMICIYLLNFKRLGYRRKAQSVLLFLALAIMAALTPLVLENTSLKDTFFGQRVLSAYHVDLQNRLGIWKTTLTAVKERPILGWGVESFSYVYDKYAVKNYITGIYFDRPHNKLIELLESGGILAFLSYFTVLFAIFYLLFKFYKLWEGYNGKPGILFASVFAGFYVCGLVQNVFGFDHIGTYLLFFLVAGFINNNFSNYKKPEQSNKPLTAEKIIFSASVFIFMIFVTYQINIKPTLAVMNFNSSIKYESTDAARAVAGYKKGISQGTLYDNDLIIAFANRTIYLLENSMGQNIGDTAVKHLLSLKPFLYDATLKKDIRPENVYEFLVRIDEWAFIVRKDPSYLADMSADLKKAIAFNPNIPSFLKLSGEMEILAGNNAQGERYLEKGCIMDTVSCNGNKAELKRLIGIAYYKKSDFKSVLENFKTALDIDYESRMKNLPDILENSVQMIDSVAIMHYTYFKDFESCKKVYLKEMEAYPQYKDILTQHLEIVTADYEKNKAE